MRLTTARHGLTPRARVLGMATAGVAPRIMGMGPLPATQKLLAQTGLSLAQLDLSAGENAADSRACREWSWMLKYDVKGWGVAAGEDRIQGGAGSWA